MRQRQNTVSLTERRRKAASSILYSRFVLVNGLRAVWIVGLVWGEAGMHFWTLRNCRWPEDQIAGSGERATRVMLIADPQVQHTMALQTSWRSIISQLFFETELKRCWMVARRLKPDIIIFLGDMLANGKHALGRTDYMTYASKFKHTFSHSVATVYYVPGNNDLGMGASGTPSKAARQNYIEAFGPFNQEISIRNHTFILLDTPGLVDEDYHRHARGVSFREWVPIPGGTVEFIRSRVQGSKPLILLSHIPLFRPESSPCGALRERGSIQRGVGHGYQNMLGKQTSTFLLEMLNPVAVYSADNRDYCEHEHLINNRHPVRETTVKSFSPAANIDYPGFQLLSLTDPSPGAQMSFLSTPCFFPNQFETYTRIYLGLTIISLVVVSIFNFIKRRRALKTVITPIHLDGVTQKRISNSSTPLFPDSMVWSPFTTHRTPSPQETLPTMLRTPRLTSDPTSRIASRPATPDLLLGLSPSPYHTTFDVQDDEDMSPQYINVPTRLRLHSSAPQDTESVDAATITSRIFVPPVHAGWSWTFVFGGKLRRVTLRVPTFSWSGLWDLVGLFEPHSEIPVRRRTLLGSIIVDIISIFTSTILAWAAILWIIL